MKFLFIYTMMMIRALSGPDHYHFSFFQHYKPVIYVWSAKSLKNKPIDEKPYLKVTYDGTNNGYCKIAFRLFVLKKGETTRYNINSKQYMGSYSLGESCTETFNIPLDEKYYEMKTGTLFFHIVPIDMDSKIISHDLKKDFKISVELR